MDASQALLVRNMITDQRTTPDYKALLWLDDNLSMTPADIHALRKNLIIVGNRIDAIKTFNDAGFTTLFNDFNVCDIATLDAIYLSASKERAVTHHCLNESRRLLSKDGTLTLVGKKDGGIKTYAKNCEKQLGFSGGLKKEGLAYVGRYRCTDAHYDKLDDQDYTRLRAVADYAVKQQDYILFSKPGVYGWKKIDSGSAFLIEYTLEQFDVTEKNTPALAALDLGCGSGYLTCALHAAGYKNIVATDNNATAILATQKTCDENTIPARVTPSDCAHDIHEKFDLILCNPPFHKGFASDSRLTKKFAKTCVSHLRTDGCAYIVTNAFIGIENAIHHADGKCKTIANNGKFKVVMVTHAT